MDNQTDTKMDTKTDTRKDKKIEVIVTNTVTNRLSTTYKECMYMSLHLLSNSWFGTLSQSNLKEIHTHCISFSGNFYKCESTCEQQEQEEDKIKCWNECIKD